MTVSLGAALIVRNEEKHLRRCLFSILDVVSEVAIVDTGSSDSTVEIASEFTNKIYHEPWADDFSLHRNQSFSHMTTDWILQIDADEELIYLNKDAPRIFLKWLEKIPKEINAITFLMRDWRESKKQYMAEFDVVRCFRRGHVKYHRRVHNDPIYKGESVIFPLIVFKHYGYDLTEEQKKKKAERTITLLHKTLAENPKDYECHFYLMQAYGAWTEKWEKAMECATEYVKHKDECGKLFNKAVYYSAAAILMAHDKLKESEEWIRNGILADRERPDLDLSWAMIQLGIKKREPDIIAQGARGFVMAYEDPQGTRHRNPGQFFFNRKPECYAIALYYKSMSFIEYGVIELKKLDEYLEKGQVDSQTKSDIIKRIEKDFTTLGLNRNSAKNEKKLIITPAEFHYPMFQKAARTKALP